MLFFAIKRPFAITEFGFELRQFAFDCRHFIAVVRGGLLQPMLLGFQFCNHGRRVLAKVGLPFQVDFDLRDLNRQGFNQLARPGHLLFNCGLFGHEPVQTCFGLPGFEPQSRQGRLDFRPFSADFRGLRFKKQLRADCLVQFAFHGEVRGLGLIPLQAKQNSFRFAQLRRQLLVALGLTSLLLKRIHPRVVLLDYVLKAFKIVFGG